MTPRVHFLLLCSFTLPLALGSEMKAVAWHQVERKARPCAGSVAVTEDKESVQSMVRLFGFWGILEDQKMWFQRASDVSKEVP